MKQQIKSAPRKFAVIGWTVDDVLQCKPDWTKAHAKAWLRDHEQGIEESMIEREWDYIQEELEHAD